MALDEENESGGLIKCTKIATSGIFSLSVMAVDTTSTMVDEETKEEEEEVANFAVDAVQEIYAEPEECSISVAEQYKQRMVVYRK